MASGPVRSLVPLAVLLATSPALAESVTPTPVAGPVPVVEHPAARTGARWHDGFYLRVGVGPGGMIDKFAGIFGYVDSQASGASTGFELAVAWEIGEGLFFGPALEADWMANPRIEEDGVTIDDNVSLGVLAMLGPFIDYYPDPGSGPHLQFMSGAARITVKDASGERTDHEPIGVGFVLGAGYDWWLGDELSLGVLGRLTLAGLWENTVHHTAGALTVMVALTYN